ncbi:hypothetical protein KR038_010531 [Drosophila bunnanda]|nr:hypothetical protein KR038_010531 [Drosophila bunnanda]
MKFLALCIFLIFALVAVQAAPGRNFGPGGRGNFGGNLGGGGATAEANANASAVSQGRGQASAVANASASAKSGNGFH